MAHFPFRFRFRSGRSIGRSIGRSSGRSTGRIRADRGDEGGETRVARAEEQVCMFRADDHVNGGLTQRRRHNARRTRFRGRGLPDRRRSRPHRIRRRRNRRSQRRRAEDEVLLNVGVGVGVLVTSSCCCSSPASRRFPRVALRLVHSVRDISHARWGLARRIRPRHILSLRTTRKSSLGCAWERERWVRRFLLFCRVQQSARQGLSLNGPHRCASLAQQQQKRGAFLTQQVMAACRPK